ncbi:hypothetical protein VPHD480_0385 [Vibrio phage D480]
MHTSLSRRRKRVRAPSVPPKIIYSARRVCMNNA